MAVPPNQRVLPVAAHNVLFAPPPAYELQQRPHDGVFVHMTNPREQQMPRVSTRMTQGERLALMKELAAAAREAERLIETYGEDHPDGTMIRFVKRFPGRTFDRANFPMIDEEVRVQLGTVTTYLYGAVRAKGKWFVTGQTQTGKTYEWEELLADVFDTPIQVQKEDIEVFPPRKKQNGIAAGVVETPNADYAEDYDDDEDNDL
jgi:hypothetical protein